MSVTFMGLVVEATLSLTLPYFRSLDIDLSPLKIDGIKLNQPLFGGREGTKSEMKYICVCVCMYMYIGWHCQKGRTVSIHIAIQRWMDHIRASLGH